MNLPRHILCLALLFHVSGSAAFSSESSFDNGLMRRDEVRDTIAVHLANLNDSLMTDLESGKITDRTAALASRNK